MSEHECIIGLLRDSYESESLVTLQELLEYINWHIKLYEDTKDEIYWTNIKPYTLKDYCDRRKKSTNLTRFEFCPYCGKKIDWKKIKNEEVKE